MSAQNNDDENTHLGQHNALGNRLNGAPSDDDIADVEERAAPGLLRFLPPLLQEFWAKKAYFSMDQSGSVSISETMTGSPRHMAVPQEPATGPICAPSISWQ